jgi:hypothetical protein
MPDTFARVPQLEAIFRRVTLAAACALYCEPVSRGHWVQKYREHKRSLEAVLAEIDAEIASLPQPPTLRLADPADAPTPTAEIVDGVPALKLLLGGTDAASPGPEDDRVRLI